MRISADELEDDQGPVDHVPVQQSVSANEQSPLGGTGVSKGDLHQRVKEMTQQFKNLLVSDLYPPSAKRRNFTFIDDASKFKPMEEADSAVEGSAQALDVAPSWLKQYLAKMKHEIKREVIEELICINQGEIQISKTSASSKLEEVVPFQGEVVHEDVFCDNCDQQIHGIRYKCGNCTDFDLCQECESLPNIHNKNHIFLKIRYPLALKLYQKQKWQELISPAEKIYAMGSSRRQSKKLYEAKFVCDETVSDGTVISPSTSFVKSWKVMNSGTRVWTHATKLHLIQGSADLAPAKEQVDVPHLKPGEEGIVSVLFTSPAHPGVYRSHWNFCHKSRPFGHIVWCHIVVKEKDNDVWCKIFSNEKEDIGTEDTDTTKKLNEPAVDNQCDKAVDNQRKDVASIAQVLTAVQEEHERGNIVPRKLAVTSHTATPNNTPFDLTPPKSPDHHEASLKEIQEVTGNDNSTPTHNHDSDNEDECSVVSLSSSESDTEFVVIPMPKCFNLSESYISRHIPQLAQYMQRSETDADGQKKYEGGKFENEEDLQPVNNAEKLTCASETISQETGVPELLERSAAQTVLKIDEVSRNIEKICFTHVAGDGSSSEISIIESEDNSPTTETIMPAIETISVSMSNDSISKSDVACKLQFPVPPIFNCEVNVGKKIEKVQETENEELSEILSSATFPKFPVEGITSVYEPTPTSPEERTVQVLPESLVNGALNAAASVYNSARAVISTIQQSRNDRGTCLSQELPETRQDLSNTNNSRSTTYLNPMDQLGEMGFCNKHQNEQLLKKHNGDVPLVVAELVSLSDNDWYASRHVPSPPEFD